MIVQLCPAPHVDSGMSGGATPLYQRVLEDRKTRLTGPCLWTEDLSGLYHCRNPSPRSPSAQQPLHLHLKQDNNRIPAHESPLPATPVDSSTGSSEEEGPVTVTVTVALANGPELSLTFLLS
nr:MAG: E4 protein [Neophocaena asiaeorientalis asiaeorientalis papillomavirus 4]